LIVAGVVILLAWPLARRMIKALRNSGQSKLIVPVVTYLGAISAMVIGAISSGNAVAAVGALLFMLSDSLIAESRFIKSPLVKNKTLTQLAIMVTYYLAQGAIVLSLLV
jgi:alkenylglycerophosphocholine hydrolase